MPCSVFAPFTYQNRRHFRSSLAGRFVPETAVCFANEGGNRDFGSQQKNPYKDLTTTRRRDKDGYAVFNLSIVHLTFSGRA
jgi:hypothetical protein